MPNRSVGGGDFFYSATPLKKGQKGIAQASGLNNIGLLICTSGRVTSTGTDFFYIDDGSIAPVKVVVGPDVTIPGQNSFVTVTGASSCFRVGDDLYRLVRPASQSDIVPR